MAGRAAARSNAEELEELEEVEEWLVDLTSADPETRSIAAFALGGARGRRRHVVAALRTALADDDPVVVNFAGQSLGMLGDSSSLSALCGLLASGPPRDRTGLAWAVAALGDGGSESDRAAAIQALTAYRRRARGRTREHAVGLIARLEKSPASTPETSTTGHANIESVLPSGLGANGK